MAAGDEKQVEVVPEMAPDPDEDDLDDLDEMLDEFSSTKIGAAPPTSSAPGPSGPGRPPPATATNEVDDSITDPSEEEFAKQLQSGMVDMLKELETNPTMAKEFEELMAQFGGPPAPPKQPQQQDTPASVSQSSKTAAASATTPSSSTSTTKPTDDAFQETIRRTMDRMKASSSSADAAATTPSAAEDDIMASLMRELQSANGGEGGDSDDTFSKMLLGMMEQLTNKEILYEPMKELNTKFPAYLEQNKGALAAGEEERYMLQQSLVKEIVDRFEKKGYSDGNAEDREYIVERMQKMQAAGAPPPDLVGDVNAASDMMNDLDAGCPQQ